MRTDLASRRAVLHKTRAAQMEKSPDLTQKPVLLKKKEKVPLTADEEDLLKDIEEFEAYKKDQAKLDADEREYQERPCSGSCGWRRSCATCGTCAWWRRGWRGTRGCRWTAAGR